MKLITHLFFITVALLINAVVTPPASTASTRFTYSYDKTCNEVKLVDALTQIRGKNYSRGRLLLQRLVNPECLFMPIARLLIADTYFREGGIYNFSKAESEYTDWLNSFPDHKLTPFVMQKVAELHIKRLGWNSANHAAGANRMLLKLQDQYPQFKDDQLVQEYLMVVQEMLADHELNVGRFYFEHRKSMVAAQSRCLTLIEKYQQFTKMDVALWILAQVEEVEDNRNKAIEYCKRIVREYPESPYSDEAIEKLKYLGGDVPEPDLDMNAVLSERRSRIVNILENLNLYTMKIPSKGVLLNEKDEMEDFSLIQDLRSK